MRKTVKKAIRFILSPFVAGDFFRFKKAIRQKRFDLNFKDIHPFIKDKTVFTHFDRHYVYHTSWAARVLKEVNPEYHTDISSSLYFSGIVSAFIPIRFYDYRPAKLSLEGFQSNAADLYSLPFADSSLKSLSCMHTVEHIGLGRYGDPIDPQGDLKAIEELVRVLSPSGSLLFVVPVGKPRIEFNAHRIYSYEQIMDYFSSLELKEFALIPEEEKDGGLIRNADPSLVAKERYACGCFWFIKTSK